MTPLLTAQVLLLGLLLGAIVGRSSIWRPVPTLGTRIIGNVVTQCNPNTAGPYTFLNRGISHYYFPLLPIFIYFDLDKQLAVSIWHILKLRRNASDMDVGL